MTEIERLTNVLARELRMTLESVPSESGFGPSVPSVMLSGEREALIAVLKAMRGPKEWMIDTDEGRAIMARRKAAYVVACEMGDGDCRGGRTNPGDCAGCADTGDQIIEAYLDAILNEDQSDG